MRSMPHAGLHRPLSRLGRWAVLSGSSVLLGCTAPSIGPEICARPETEQPSDYKAGFSEDGVYMSADWDGELLAYPGGAFYRIHHGLGEEPRWWNVYLSFNRYGLRDKQENGLADGSLSEAAGNQAEVKAIDAETITILNGSCGEYYMLAVVGTSADPPAP